MVTRPYGSGRLFVRRDRNGRESWYGSWWVGGRRVKRKIGPKRTEGTRQGVPRAQAEAQLRRLMSETVIASTGGAVSLAEAGERYLAHLANVLEWKPTTIQDYRIMLDRHLLRFFGDVRLSAISAEKVAAFINAQRRAGLAANTVRNHVNLLHGLLGFAVRRGWTAVNPVDQVDKPRQARHREQRIQFLSPPEVDALLRAVPDDVLGQVERPLYLTAAMTGLRIGAARPALARRGLGRRPHPGRGELHARDVRQPQERPRRSLRPARRSSRRRARAPLPGLGVPGGRRPRVLPPGDRQRPRSVEAAEALPPRA